jgi:hypothetical protein
MTVREDDSRMRRIALSLVKRDTASKQSLKRRRRICGYENEYLERLPFNSDSVLAPRPPSLRRPWLLHQRAESAPIVGATKMKHLEEAIAAVDIELSAEEMRRLEEPYVVHPVLMPGAAQAQKAEAGKR